MIENNLINHTNKIYIIFSIVCWIIFLISLLCLLIKIMLIILLNIAIDFFLNLIINDSRPKSIKIDDFESIYFFLSFIFSILSFLYYIGHTIDGDIRTTFEGKGIKFLSIPLLFISFFNFNFCDEFLEFIFGLIGLIFLIFIYKITIIKNKLCIKICFKSFILFNIYFIFLDLSRLLSKFFEIKDNYKVHILVIYIIMPLFNLFLSILFQEFYLAFFSFIYYILILILYYNYYDKEFNEFIRNDYIKYIIVAIILINLFLIYLLKKKIKNKNKNEQLIELNEY